MKAQRNNKGGYIVSEPIHFPEPPDSLLHDLYELYFPPRDEEMYLNLVDWSEWADLH